MPRKILVFRRCVTIGLQYPGDLVCLASVAKMSGQSYSSTQQYENYMSRRMKAKCVGTID